jgi:hypothetical protein
MRKFQRDKKNLLEIMMWRSGLLLLASQLVQILLAQRALNLLMLPKQSTMMMLVQIIMRSIMRKHMTIAVRKNLALCNRISIFLKTLGPIPEVAGPSRLTGKLPISNMVSKQADAAIPVVDDQGFQTVTSKATKKSEKKIDNQKNSKQKPYITRSKVGSSKPFR